MQYYIWNKYMNLEYISLHNVNAFQIPAVIVKDLCWYSVNSQKSYEKIWREQGLQTSWSQFWMILIKEVLKQC